jgi:hypothetical protein
MYLTLGVETAANKTNKEKQSSVQGLLVLNWNRKTVPTHFPAMKSVALSCAIVAAAFVGCAAQTPIPARPDGWKIGSPGAPIVLESYFDLMVSLQFESSAENQSALNPCSLHSVP